MKYILYIFLEVDNPTSYLGKTLLGLDVASSHFEGTNKNECNINFKIPKFTRETSKFFKGDGIIILYKNIVEARPIIPIKDTFDQKYWSKWSKFTKGVEEKVHNFGVGYLTVASLVKNRKATEQMLANYILIKVNHIYSASMSIKSTNQSKKRTLVVMTSHC